MAAIDAGGDGGQARLLSMATYAIGDVQGCYTELRELLDALAFDPSRDTLWFVGDLVNRGPASLDVMRFVRGLGDRAVAVLGNHDLHLIAVALGTQKTRRDDTLDAVLAAPDRDDLVDWLHRLPLLHVAQGHALVHAGLLPQWNIDQAAQLAREVESALRGPQHRQGPAYQRPAGEQVPLRGGAEIPIAGQRLQEHLHCCWLCEPVQRQLSGVSCRRS